MINLPVTLDRPQRDAVMTRIRSQWPATQGTTQAVNQPGRFSLIAVRGAELPADLTADIVRGIVFEVVATTEATRPGTFQTARTYDRSGQRTRKPRHARWSN